MESHVSDKSVFVYNYLTNLYSFSYIENLSDEPLAWGYNSVTEQTCVLIGSGSDTNSVMTEINSRRTLKIKLVANGFSFESNERRDFGFRLLNSKSVLKWPAFHKRIIKNDLEFRFESVTGLTKSIGDLRDINYAKLIEADYNINHIKLLLKRRLISLEIIYQSNSKTAFGCAIILSLQNIALVEFILFPTSHSTEDIINQIVEKTIKSQNLNRKKTLVILNSDVLKKIDSERFNQVGKIHIYEKQAINNPLLPVQTIQQSAVLKEKAEFLNAISITKFLGLPKHNDLPKNWDSLAALSQIINCPFVKKNSPILDAGGEYYSVLLHQLAIYGFINLYCINLAFTSRQKISNIRYQPGDITKSNFRDNTFAAVTCLSVIEHGVDPENFFAEMRRILQPGGILFISVDYWKIKINAGERFSYGAPIKIFSGEEVIRLNEIAGKNNFTLAAPVDLSCKQRVIACDGLKYTFLYLTFIKTI
jgi:SAM-dependent methyltransferase